MKFRIFLSIFCVSLAVLLLSCCTVTWLAQNTVRDNSFKPLISYAETLASAIQSEKTQLIKNGALFPYRVTLINPDGSISFDSEADPSHMENHLERQEVRNALQTGHGSATRISDTLSERTDYYALRLANGQVLRCSATISTIFQNMHLLIAEALGILLFAALISAVLAKHIAKRIVAPINNINLDHPLEANIYDELSPLVKRLESQQKHIGEQIQRIKRQSEELSAVTASMTEGLVILNSRGEIISLNRSAQKILHADAQVTGKNFLSVDHAEYVLSLFDDDKQDLTDKRASIERDGQIYDVFISRVGNDELLGYVLIYVNVTASRLAETQRREFTANVSHELKTPLQSIIGASELLESGLVQSGDEPNFYKKISREATALLHMINDIILLSRLDEGSAKEATEMLNPKKICCEIAKALEDSAATKGITLSVLGDLASFPGIYRYFYEMIFNLADNAVKYGKEHGHVSIELKTEANCKVIEVKDDGPGISQEDQQRIFERFYRVDKSHSRRSEGSGLGLSIVKRAARFFGGNVSVRSHLGKGACFRIEIPDSERN